MDVKASPNPAEALRRSEECMMLINNAPKPGMIRNGMSTNDLVLLYAKEHRVEKFFMGVKTRGGGGTIRVDILVNAGSVGGLFR